MARPRKQPAHYVEKLCQALELGAWIWQACRYAHVSSRTVRTWMVAGEAEDAEAAMHAFAQRIRQAEAEGAVRLLGQINAAATHDWRAAAWLYDHQGRRAQGARTRAAVGISYGLSPGGDAHE
jgi:hypothetical protein